ncbi:hypothetical protein [Variovorax sp. 350MFTsu5.1]|uniref:hypothetical protein n=1 Tax=Variovorax sp. 350MFTsu5.1 TaxID=3158365 RepID=UPI003AAF4A15
MIALELPMNFSRMKPGFFRTAAKRVRGVREFHMTHVASARHVFGAGIAAIGMMSLCLGCGSAHGQPSDQGEADRGPTSQPLSSSDLSADQALQRMLELIRSSRSVADVTPASMQRALGVQVKKVDSQQFGYGQRLPGNWAFGIMRQDVSGAGRVDLTFSPLPGMQPVPWSRCEPDFARFTARLASMGFARHSSYGEHGRWLYDVFERPGMRVEVYPLPAEPRNDGAPAPACVQMVLMQ